MEGDSELIDNEWYIVRYSGETPEIAYNSAIYFLTRAADGPKITLLDLHRDRLKQAAADRYEEIVLRDMYHENAGTSIYRGVARSICNYQRFAQFCNRQDLSIEEVRKKARNAFSTFLRVEFERLSSRSHDTVINCSFVALKEFAVTLDLAFLPEYTLFEDYCQDTSE